MVCDTHIRQKKTTLQNGVIKQTRRDKQKTPQIMNDQLDITDPST
jgi:hypothetical protein